jgi:voltage-gated potassium channel Kch
VEIGGFLAGLALANVAEQAQIISRVRPLRDFFLTWFFVGLGANIGCSGWQNMVVPGLLMSVYVLVGGPLIVMAILGLLGYKKRTYFMASLAVAQVSEFSLILVTNAVRVGQVRPEILTLVTGVGIITMTMSTYMIWYANSLYKKLLPVISIFERKKTKEEEGEWKEMAGHAVLFGHNRVGSRVRPVLEKTGWEVLVVDFNPEVVEKLKNDGVKVVYGDMSDQELYEKLALGKASLIVSTIPNLKDNLHLLSWLSGNKDQMTVVTANDTDDAKILYGSGADYVLVPHNVGGEFLAQVLTHHGSGNESTVRLNNLKAYLGKSI